MHWAASDLKLMMERQATAQLVKTATLKPKSPAGTAKPTGISSWYQGSSEYLV